MDDQGTFYSERSEADLESIFAAAVELTSNGERASYLDRACAHDPELRAEVEKLLAAHADAGDFMRDTNAPGTEPPGTRVGPYKLLQVIGEGGMGTVYMAEQTEPVERRVALKIIKPGMAGGEITARFEAERQALALMDHPNIAKVFDAGATKTGRPYFAMELVKGIPITDYCDRHGYGPRRRLELFVRVCHAVQHAHQKGIIHRDIKPANVLVAEYGDEAAPKIIDFGIAKATGPRLTEKTMYTQYGQIVGTFEYMSPEQAKLDQLDVDTRTDIYALGVLLYELLTGTTPFERARLQAAGFEEILRIIREEDPPKPSTRLSTLGDRAASVTATRRSDLRNLRRDLRGELDWVVMRAMEKERSRRYESAAGLAADVERHLDGEPVRACPPSTAYRVRKFVRRHRGPVTAAAALLLTLLLGLGGTSVGLIQAVEAREAQRKLTFSMALDRGLNLCDDRQVGHGMLWLARALEICPPDATAHQRVVRANLNAWHRELNSLEAVFPHDESVISVAFSPDGAMLVTASNDDTAQRWDARTGTRIGAPLPHSGDAHEAVFSSDGTRILTSDYGTTAFLWDAASGALLHRFDHEALLVPGVAFRPPDDRQVITSGGSVVTIWDAESGEAVGTLPDHPHLVHDVAVSADGSRILTACHDNNVRLWDFDSRRLLAIIEHETRVPTVAFAGEGDSYVASGDADGNVYFWNLNDALEGATETVELSVAAADFTAGRRGHHGGVHRLRAGPHGRRILTASFDNTARMWDPVSGAEVGTPFEHQTACQGASFSADGSRVATTCDDNAARVWRPAVGQAPRVVEHPTETHEAVYTSDGRYILIKRDEGTVLVRDAVTGARVCEFRHEGAVRVAAAAADGSRIFIGSENQTCLLVDIATGEALFPSFEHPSGVWAVALSPDGTRTLSGDFYGSVQVRDARTGALVRETELGARVWAAAFSPDSSRLVVGGSDKLGRVFDADVRNPLHRLAGHQSAVVAVAFSSDGTQIVTGSQDNTVRVWDAATGEPRSKPMVHPGSIWYSAAVGFSPDGRTVVTGCDDLTARVWDVATSQPIGPALRHETGTRMVAFVSDSQIRTGTTTGTVRTWNVTTSPLEGDVERIKLWVQVRTGMELDDAGRLHSLDAATWKRRRARLAELGGAPIDG